MAKLMVCIDFPETSYEKMRKMIDSRKKDTEAEAGFFSEEDGDKVVISDLDLERSKSFDGSYVFELLGVRP